MEHWTPHRPDENDDEWLRLLPPLPAAPASSEPPSPEPPRRRRWFTAVVAIVVGIGLLASAASLGTRARHPTPQERGGPKFSFIDTKMSGDPVRWNPCEPIHYVVNDALARYPEAIADAHVAAQRVSEATGIEFVYDGETTEEAAPGRSSFQLRYGKEWAPVLIAWTDPDDSPIEFERGSHVALGVASPSIPTHGRFDMFVSGWVALNADYAGPGGFDSPSSVGLTIQHELGHVMGLGHTKAFGELMQGAGGGALDWGPGDLEGLRALGAEAGCLTTPDAEAA